MNQKIDKSGWRAALDTASKEPEWQASRDSRSQPLASVTRSPRNGSPIIGIAYDPEDDIVAK